TTEPGTSDVFPQGNTGGIDPGVESFRPCSSVTTGRLVEGATTPASQRHNESRGWTKGNLLGSNAGRHRWGDDPARPERSSLVQRRTVARQHANQHSGILVYVLVRRVDWPKSRRLQSRTKNCVAGNC